jgi:hypothetical protein
MTTRKPLQDMGWERSGMMLKDRTGRVIPRKRKR